jgi:hypothetical protein
MVGVLNPSYEFSYDRLMTKGDKFCHWKIRRTTPGLPTNQETPLEILKMRYARGEITKEQYLEMRSVLE